MVHLSVRMYCNWSTDHAIDTSGSRELWGTDTPLNTRIGVPTVQFGDPSVQFKGKIINFRALIFIFQKNFQPCYAWHEYYISFTFSQSHYYILCPYFYIILT